MLALMAILVAAAYYGWLGVTQGWVSDDTTSAGDAEETCTTPPPVVVRTKSVRVSVYNASASAGEATELMEALARRGFRQGEVTDAPDSIDVKGIAVWPGNAGPGESELVARQFRTVRVAGKRERTLGPGVNIVLGRDFSSLSPKAPRRIEVDRPEECSAPS